jgi:2',3'-cyclic-nucleotide 2'-phosphodiesterase (5'-nucleotidase family)
VLCDARILDLNDADASPAIEARIGAFRAKLEDFLAVPVGITQTPLDTRLEIVRTQETAFGNLVADALRSAVNADAAIMNSGGIRGNRRYAAATRLTWGDLQGELPFRNRLTLLEVTGEQLRAALEEGLNHYEEQTGAFPQVSGLTLYFDPSKAPGDRVVDLRVGGEPVRSGSLYRLATVDFLASGGDGYASLEGARRLPVGMNTLVWEAVRAYLQQHSPIAPQLEGRLVRVRP